MYGVYFFNDTSISLFFSYLKLKEIESDLPFVSCHGTVTYFVKHLPVPTPLTINVGNILKMRISPRSIVLEGLNTVLLRLNLWAVEVSVENLLNPLVSLKRCLTSEIANNLFTQFVNQHG